MSYRINGVDCLTLHQVSILCAAAVDAGLDSDELGALYMDEEPNLGRLANDLAALLARSQPQEVAEGAAIALRAIDG